MRRIDFYKVKRNDNLAAANFWNSRFEDIDLRLAARENDANSITEAIDSLQALGLQRLTDTFTPLIQEAQAALSTYGVDFTAISASSVPVEDGTATFVLTAETRDAFYYAQYVSIIRTSDPNTSMLGTVMSYERATGTLVVYVVSHTGSGTHSDWTVNLSMAPDTSHTGRTDNPHEVTAAQVGAYTTAQTDSAISTAISELPPISTALLKASNLSDLQSAATARTNLGLGALAIESLVGTGMLASSVRSTQAQAEAGTDNVTLMTPLRVAQAHAAGVPATIDGGTF